MTATNRSKYRVENDYYATPEWGTRAMLRTLSWRLGLSMSQNPVHPKHWLEPGSGEGAIIKAVNTYCDEQEWIKPIWTAIDVDPVRAARLPGTICEDFIQWRPEHSVYEQDVYEQWQCDGQWRFDVVCGNPPFSLAEDFIFKSLQLAPIVVFLLRLDFLGTQKRIDFWDNIPVADLAVSQFRFKFRGKRSDSCEYAWYIWDSLSATRKNGQWEFLQVSPEEYDKSLKKPKMFHGSVLD